MAAGPDIQVQHFIGCLNAPWEGVPGPNTAVRSKVSRFGTLSHQTRNLVSSFRNFGYTRDFFGRRIDLASEIFLFESCGMTRPEALVRL
jgi:hypothetical protein